MPVKIGTFKILLLFQINDIIQGPKEKLFLRTCKMHFFLKSALKIMDEHELLTPLCRYMRRKIHISVNTSITSKLK